jgi:hypothetical protein
MGRLQLWHINKSASTAERFACRHDALAIKFQDMVDRGEVRDYADLARLGYVNRARLTQIMNLLLLAPRIQEQPDWPRDMGKPYDDIQWPAPWYH